MDEPNSADSKLQALDKLPPGFKSYLLDYYQKASNVALTPKLFFETMPTTGGLKEPFLFLLGSTTVAILGVSLLSMHLFEFPIMLATSLASTFLVALVAKLLARSFGGKADFEATFRVYAYASCLNLLAWVPILGSLAWFYELYVTYIGLKKVHELSPAKTAITIVLTGILTAILLFVSLATTVMRHIFHF
ncbi:MAG: YIP1 family protein [Candidatus Obscuribacterales bacterium]|nr:YIP1 family protein [Candidatus Obscuribacterales bacterium]